MLNIAQYRNSLPKWLSGPRIASAIPEKLPLVKTPRPAVLAVGELLQLTSHRLPALFSPRNFYAGEVRETDWFGVKVGKVCCRRYLQTIEGKT